jgi:hypothetical protein
MESKGAFTETLLFSGIALYVLITLLNPFNSTGWESFYNEERG